MDLEKIIQGIRHGIQDRLTSPFWLSFFISWSILNYETYIILFSDNTVTTTLLLMQTHAFPSQQDILLNAFLYPLLSALSYVYAYPYPCRWFYTYTLGQQLRLNEVKQNLEKTRLLTLEESNSLVARFAEQEDNYQKEIEILKQKNRALLESNKAFRDVPSRTDFKNSDKNLSNNSPHDLTDLEYRILDALADIAELADPNDEDEITRETLSNSYLVGSKTIDLEHAIGRLVERSLLDQVAYQQARRLKFTQAGRETFISHREMKRP